jgi:hypothetical protein
MARITLRPDDPLDHLDTEADEHGVSRSEHLRDIPVSHRERRQLLEQREEHTELVRHAEAERSIQPRREQRRQANVFRRAWRWLAGEPSKDVTT